MKRNLIISECNDKIDSCKRRIELIDKWLESDIKKQFCANKLAEKEKDLLNEMQIFASSILKKI